MEICYSPLVGKAVNLDHVADEMFSQRMLGDGMAIAPEAREVYSPVAGEITMVYETQHAIGIKRRPASKSCCISALTPSCWGERRSTPRCRSAITFSPAIC